MQTPFTNYNPTQSPRVSSFIQYLIDTGGQPRLSSTIDTQLMPFNADLYTSTVPSSTPTPVDLPTIPNSLHLSAQSSLHAELDIDQIIAAIEALQIPTPLTVYPRVFLSWTIQDTLNSRNTREEFATIRGIPSWSNVGDPGSFAHAASIAGARYQAQYAAILWAIHRREPHTLMRDYAVLNVVPILDPAPSGSTNPRRPTDRFLPVGFTAIGIDGVLNIQHVVLYGCVAKFLSGEVGVEIKLILMLRPSQALDSTSQQLVHESEMLSQLPSSLSSNAATSNPYMRHIPSSSSADYTRPSIGNDDGGNSSDMLPHQYSQPHRYSPPLAPSPYGPIQNYSTASGVYGSLRIPSPSKRAPATSNPYGQSDEKSMPPPTWQKERKRSGRPDLGTTITSSDGDNKHIAPPYRRGYPSNRPQQISHSAVVSNPNVARDQDRGEVVATTSPGDYQSREFEPPVASGSGSGSGSAMATVARRAIDDIKTHMPPWGSSPFNGTQESAPGGSKGNPNNLKLDERKSELMGWDAGVEPRKGMARNRRGAKPRFAENFAREGAPSHLSLTDSISGSRDGQGRNVSPPVESVPTRFATSSSITNEGRVVGSGESAPVLGYHGIKREREGEAERESIKRARRGEDAEDKDKDSYSGSYY